MAEEIGFENGRNSNFEGLVTLTLTLDPAIRHTAVHHSSTSTYQISFKSKKLFVDGRTDVRTDGHFSPSNIIRSTFGSRPKKTSCIRGSLPGSRKRWRPKTDNITELTEITRRALRAMENRTEWKKMIHMVWWTLGLRMIEEWRQGQSRALIADLCITILFRYRFLLPVHLFLDLADDADQTMV